MPLSPLERRVIESKPWAVLRAIEVRKLTSGLVLGGAKILNVGAGNTNLTQTLLGSSVKCVTNIDSQEFPNLDQVADATDLPFGNNEFDVIIFLRVLHHIENFRPALDEALRCTKPGGFILISEPYSLFAKAARAVGLESCPPNIITRSDIETFAIKNELAIRKRLAWTFLHYYGYQIQVPV